MFVRAGSYLLLQQLPVLWQVGFNATSRLLTAALSIIKFYSTMKTYKCAFSSWLVLFTFLAFNLQAQTAFKKLVWSDEFNKPGAPDTAKWNYETGRGCPDNCGWGNNELEYYTTNLANAVIENGVLKINAFKEDFNGSNYTSAKLVTRGRFAFTYGRVEFSAKLPAVLGSWPAVWMLGNNIDSVPWPDCGEIDIMEHRGRDLNLIFGTLHYPGRSGDHADGNTRMISNASTQFHKYELEWTSKSIKMLVDGMLVHEVANSVKLPFNHDFYLIMNLATGGNFAGTIDPGFKSATMEIDYIRVYQ